MIVGGYTLDLYCDNKSTQHAHGWIDINDVGRGKFPKQFTGRTYTGCAAEARRNGWKIKGDVAICPDCRQKRGKP